MHASPAVTSRFSSLVKLDETVTVASLELNLSFKSRSPNRHHRVRHHPNHKFKLQDTSFPAGGPTRATGSDRARQFAQRSTDFDWHWHGTKWRHLGRFQVEHHDNHRRMPHYRWHPEPLALTMALRGLRYSRQLRPLIGGLGRLSGFSLVKPAQKSKVFK